MCDSEDDWTEAHKQAINMPLSTDLTLPNFAKKYLPEGRRKALDVGCGLGIPLNAFLRAGFTVTGIDQCQYAIDVCKQRFPHLKLYCIRAQKIDQIFKREFDLAYTVAVLQHNVPERKRAIVNAVKKVLKDGGYFLTAESTGAEAYPDDDLAYTHPGDPYCLSKGAWVKFMRESGYEVVEMLPLGKDAAFMWRVVG